MKVSVEQLKKRYEKWLKALRSEKYEQCTGTLRQGPKTKRTYCCLGVAATACIGPMAGYSKIQDHFSYSDQEQHKLISLNDSKGKNFKFIANYIEKSVMPKVLKRIEVA